MQRINNLNRAEKQLEIKIRYEMLDSLGINQLIAPIIKEIIRTIRRAVAHSPYLIKLSPQCAGDSARSKVALMI